MTITRVALMTTGLFADFAFVSPSIRAAGDRRGRVGTGFSEKLLKTLSVELNKIAVKGCPFYNLPSTGHGLDPGLTAAEMKRCIWVKPAMVCQVKFMEWTRNDRLRQPVFLGIREDKNASEVVREKVS
jgi:bifunctional non-homologous end joining protein LigD